MPVEKAPLHCEGAAASWVAVFAFSETSPLPSRCATVVSAVSRYALLTASFEPTGDGTLGGTENCFTPEMVSFPDLCTTTESAALLATAVSTYCREAKGVALLPAPKVVLIIAKV